MDFYNTFLALAFTFRSKMSSVIEFDIGSNFLLSEFKSLATQSRNFGILEVIVDFKIISALKF